VEALSTACGNGDSPAEFFLGQRYAVLCLKEMGDIACGFEYPAVKAAIARFETRSKVDWEFCKKIKREGAKQLNIEI